jgi:hypothetical protein
VAEQSGGEDTRVVDDQQVARTQQLGEVVKMAIDERAGLPVEDQQTRGAAIRQWFLCDELGREIEREVGELQAIKSIAPSKKTARALPNARAWNSVKGRQSAQCTLGRRSTRAARQSSASSDHIT